MKNNNFKDFYQETSYPDLKTLVIPKWDNTNLEIYLKPFRRKMTWVPIFTTRGCVFNCKFCSVSKFFGKTYRVKPISHVINEIESLRAKDYFFVDDKLR